MDRGIARITGEEKLFGLSMEEDTSGVGNAHRDVEEIKNMKMPARQIGEKYVFFPRAHRGNRWQAQSW